MAAQALDNFIKQHKIKGKIAVACSGGIDSLALCVLLKNHDITALIVDHALRKKSSGEAAQAEKILAGLGIKSRILRKPHNIKTNIQEEARELRYGLLLDYCIEHKIRYLATAHHREDNAETFLLRLSRGSGLDGLSGIAPISAMRGVKIIRPVLSWRKADLKKILSEKKISWVEDPSNGTDKYKRNRLRHALEKLEDADLITQRITDGMTNLARVRNYVEAQAEKAYKSCVSDNILDVARLGRLHDEIAYRVLSQLIMDLSGAVKKPRFEKLKRLKDDLLQGKVRTLNGLIFRPKKPRFDDKIIISIEKPGQWHYIKRK